MKILTWLLTLPIILVCIIFAVSNRQVVALNLWPFAMQLEAPLFIMALGTFLAGFLVGGLGFWLAGLRHIWDKSRMNKKISKLTVELDEEKAKHALH